MNDTHGVEGKGWYGFDLDGTLAVYDTWEGIDHIGKPVKPMVDLIKKLHDEGKVVKILTARVAPRPNPETKLNPYPTDQDIYDAVGRDNERMYADMYRKPDWTAFEFIVDWCLKNLGFLPEITHEKDHLMLTLFDDRVKQVVPNKGLLVEDLYQELRTMANKLHADNGWLLAQLASKHSGFCAGFFLATLLNILTVAGIKAYDTWFSLEKEPARVRFETAHKVLRDLVNDWPVKDDGARE